MCTELIPADWGGIEPYNEDQIQGNGRVVMARLQQYGAELVSGGRKFLSETEVLGVYEKVVGEIGIETDDPRTKPSILFFWTKDRTVRTAFPEAKRAIELMYDGFVPFQRGWFIR
jgi:hypothetical protein